MLFILIQSADAPWASVFPMQLHHGNLGHYWVVSLYYRIGYLVILTPLLVVPWVFLSGLVLNSLWGLVLSVRLFVSLMWESLCLSSSDLDD